MSESWLAIWQSMLASVTGGLHGSVSAMDMPALLALAAALGWASGLRLYAVLFLAGGAGLVGWIELPAGLHVLQNPLMLIASGGMLVVEFFADKIPGLDSLWDVLHTFIRVPGGALLAAGVFGPDDGTMAVVAGLLGGSLAATALATKATARAAANTSPEPFSNISLSLFEDGLVVAALWLATQHPLAFAVVLAITLVLMGLLLVTLLKFLKAVFRRIGSWFEPAPAQ